MSPDKINADKKPIRLASPPAYPFNDDEFQERAFPAVPRRERQETSQDKNHEPENK